MRVQVASSLAFGRVSEGQLDAYLMPRVRRNTPLPPVVYLHGVASTATEAVKGTTPAVYSLLRQIAADRIVVAPTATNNWGNATGMARFTEVLAFARSLGASDDPPIIIAVSHGSAWAIKVASEMPVSRLVLMIPAIDMETLRANDPPNLNLRAFMDTAFEPNYPDPLPEGANAFDRDISHVPTTIYYAPDDPVSVNVEQFADSNGAELHSVGNLGHTNAAVAAVPHEEVLSFVRKVS